VIPPHTGREEVLRLYLSCLKYTLNRGYGGTQGAIEAAAIGSVTNNPDMALRLYWNSVDRLESKRKLHEIAGLMHGQRIRYSKESAEYLVTLSAAESSKQIRLQR
jgi:hypothetical protein